MKVRITKVPDKSLNAKKWKHENGGFMNKYDWETQNTGFLRRILNTPTMVPNMTGTATAAATGLRDIPLTESTVGNELAVAGTALASPFVMSTPQFAGNAINWISNPANQILATKLAVPLLGGAAVEEGVRSYTPYSGVGNLLYNAPTVPWSNWSPAYSQARRGAPQWERNLTEGLLGFANPGYFLSPELMAPAMDRVMQGYASDFATHVKEPLKKANQYARDWYDFVVKGNDAKYRDALSNVLSLKGEEEMLAMGLRPYEYNAASYPKYSINYQDAVLNSGDAAQGSMRMYPSEVAYGSDRIPMVVEDIGMPGNTRVTFLRSVPEGDLAKLTPGEYENIVFENASRPHNRIYRQTAIGDEYVSPLTGQVRKSPSAVLAKPEPARGNAFVTSGADDSELIESYAKEVSGGSHIPVQRGEASGAAKIAKHIEEDVMPLVGDDVALTGSTVLYKNKILSGKPGDYEFLVAEEDFPALERKLQMTGTFDNGFAIEGSSPLLRSGNGSHNVDAQVVRMDKYGEANGKVAWSLFKTMHPEEYEAQAANSIGLNKNFYDMHIINPSTGLPYKPKELIAEFKNGGYDTQHVINEAMAISKPYNKAPKGSLPGTEQNAIDLLKQDRALSLLTSKDPQVKSMVRKAIDDNAKTALGADYIHGHDFFPSLDFADAKNNEVFLKHLGINPKNIADDPEMMRNIFDQWFLVRTSRYREVANMPNMAGVKRAVGTGNVPMQGSVAASGRNAVSGGYYGSTVGDPQRGMFQQMPTYRTEMSDMTDMGDIMKMFKRTEEGYKFTSQEVKELNDELVSIFTDMQNDMSLREGGIGRNGAKKILAKLQSSPIKTLEELDEFFNKARGSLQSNGLSDITASDIIQRVSEKIDIPEFIATGRWNYQSKYTGIWNRNAPKAASYRYANDGYWKPFEVGRDFRDFGVVSGKSGSDKSPISLYESDLLPDDGSRQLMQAIYEGGTLGTDANTLLRAGAKPIYSDKTTKELIDHLEQIREVNDLGAKELGYLRRYSDMPFAKKRVGNIEYETGMNYRNGQVEVHDKRFGNRSMKSLGDEMIKTAPFDKRYGYIQDISARRDGSYRVKAVNDKGQEIEYFVSRDKSNKNAWKWEVNNVADDLPFALGGYMNRINSKYGNDPDKIRQIFANARSRQKK